MSARATVCLIAALVSACSMWPAGKDPEGAPLLQNANAVLAALNRCVKISGKPPATLQALVPRYIAALPAQPEFNYSAKHRRLVFNYSPTWPNPGIEACEARIGETAFRCEGIR